MNKVANRHYNPLNEGYSGNALGLEGYTGGKKPSKPPKNFPAIQSGVTKPGSMPSSSNNDSKSDR